MTFYNEKGKHDFKNRLPIIEIVSVTTKMKNLESSQQQILKCTQCAKNKSSLSFAKFLHDSRILCKRALNPVKLRKIRCKRGHFAKNGVL